MLLTLVFILTASMAQAENLPAIAPSAAFIPALPEKTATPQPASSPAPTSGEEVIDITADQSLEWREDERVYIATGNARAKKGDVTIEADILKAYDRKKPGGSSEVWRMTAQGNVRITSTKQRATGETAEYDIDTKKAILKGRNLQFITDTDTVTASDSLEFWEAENKAIAKGNAVNKRKDREVRADMLIAQFKKNAKGDLVAETMAAKGKVHITSAKDVAKCDDALYHVAPNTALLTGNVFITQGQNQLKGDKVEADFKTGRSKLINHGTGRVHALIIPSKGK